MRPTDHGHAVFGGFWGHDLMVTTGHDWSRRASVERQVLAEMRAERLSILSTVEELQAEAGLGLS